MKVYYKRGEVQEIFKSERWSSNTNNDSGKYVQGFAGGVQQSETTYIGILHGLENIKKSKVQGEMEKLCLNNDLKRI